jgi:antitoxin component YwqK of YwqJK toxin-antitoxin module
VFEHGQRRDEVTYKGGKPVLETHWHSNGQKRMELIYKDGKKDGKWTQWDGYGQKVSEGISNDDTPGIFLE